jgi:ribosomal-protein-alanine N-acetyltransferase
MNTSSPMELEQRAEPNTLPVTVSERNAHTHTHGADALVRKATRKDRWAICAIECACFGWERLPFGLWQRVGNAHTQAWFAELAAQGVGYLIAYPKPFNGVETLYVGGVGVRLEARKRGIGAVLMGAVMHTHSAIWLHVRARNLPAVTMYEKLGFQLISNLPRFYANGEDAFVMYWTKN